MSLAKCLIKFPIDSDDLDAIKGMVKDYKNESMAIEAFSKNLSDELEGLRGQLTKAGHDVIASETAVRGKFDDETEAAIAAADETYNAATAWEEVMNVARTCVLK